MTPEQIAFTIPNYLLAALFYTLLGRLLLGLFVPEGWDNYIWRALLRLTAPPLAVVRVLTPQAIAPALHGPLALAWLLGLRMALFLLFQSAGWITPPAAGGAG
ncbi:MAG: YggT family protein [Pseudomonadota bacterium]|nr:YggT family protein [Pseudomonadota bacterium]